MLTVYTSGLTVEVVNVEPAPAPPPPAPTPAPEPGGLLEPAITGETQPTLQEQYAVYDGGSVSPEAQAGGPNWQNWSGRLGIKWTNTNTGDWLDVDLTPQGPTPFLSVPAAPAGSYKDFTGAAMVTLVTRALSEGNKGWRIVTNPPGWAYIAGRTSANPPLLTVVTTDGTFNCACTASALYYPSSTSAGSTDSRTEVRLGSSAWTSIFRFDLSLVTGPVQSATMRLHVNQSGGTGPQLRVFECAVNRGPLQVGAGILEPQLGLAHEVGEANLPTHPDVYMAGDFEGTTFNTATGIGNIPKLFGRFNCHPDDAPEIVADEQAPGTFYYRGSFAPLDPNLTNLGSAPQRGAFDGTKRLMEPDLTNPLCPPANVVDELYYRMYFMLEDDFVSIYDANKMCITFDLRMGYWANGYWQNTTGNGGIKGSGKRFQRVVTGIGERYVYEGHMERMEQGFIGRSDDSLKAYRTLAGYNYHIDQAGPFPGGTADPLGGVVYHDILPSVFKNGRWYCIEQRLKMNTINMSTTDAQGNGVANADGLIETWLNGVKVSSVKGYRWRHHPQMGICQINANWYYGGRNQLDNRMHFRMNNLVAAKRYIGPRTRRAQSIKLPSYVPATNNVATLTKANGWLTNNLKDVCAPYYESTMFWNIRNGDAGPTLNPYWGTFGGLVIHGAGHASTNDNTVAMLEFGQSAMAFKRLTDPTPLYGTGTDGTTRLKNSKGNLFSDTGAAWVDLSRGEFTHRVNSPSDLTRVALDNPGSNPAGSHTCGIGDVVGPADGGAAHGTYYNIVRDSWADAGYPTVAAAHKVDFASASGAAGSYSWQRAVETVPGVIGQLIPAWTQYVSKQNRIYYEARWATALRTPRWLDLSAGKYVIGTGAGRNNSLITDSVGGRLVYVPERDLLLWCGAEGGSTTTLNATLSIRYMSVGVADTNPSWVSTKATLSQTLPVPNGFSAMTWCADNSRLLVANVLAASGSPTPANAVYEIEIPSTLSGTWTVTEVALPSGQTLPIPQQTANITHWGAPTYKGWEYNPKLRSVVYYPQAPTAPYADTVYLYRPRNT
jgi:hypothetical protein